MNADQKNILISWLNAACAIKKNLRQNLQEKSKDAEVEGKLDIKTKIEESAQEAMAHSEKVVSCIERLGGKLSKNKEVLAENLDGLRINAKRAYKDTLIRNILDDYAAKHLEIAIYIAIISAAEELEDKETARVCREILADEEKNKKWIEEQIPILVKEFLSIQKN